MAKARKSQRECCASLSHTILTEKWKDTYSTCASSHWCRGDRKVIVSNLVWCVQNILGMCVYAKHQQWISRKQMGILSLQRWTGSDNLMESSVSGWKTFQRIFSSSMTYRWRKITSHKVKSLLWPMWFCAEVTGIECVNPELVLVRICVWGSVLLPLECLWRKMTHGEKHGLFLLRYNSHSYTFMHRKSTYIFYMCLFYEKEMPQICQL